MLIAVKDFLLNLARGASDIKLEDAIMHGENKLAIVMSKKDYMASFEITSSLEYDFLVIDSNDETIVMNKTSIPADIQELFAEIEADYNAFVRQ